MTLEIKVPVLPESVSDATVLTWRKKIGDFVKRGETLLDLETDKVVLEVPASQDGVLTEIITQAGSVVKNDDCLGKMDNSATSGVSVTPAKSEVVSEEASKQSTNTVSMEKKDSTTPDNVSDKNSQPSQAKSVTQSIGPASRRHNLSQELQVNSHQNQDNFRNIQSNDIGDSVSVLQDRKVPMSRLRARVAERLVSVMQNSAILTTFNEVRMDNIMAIRNKYKDSFEKKHQIKLGFMSFFVKAVVTALQAYPVVNASIDGSDIIYHDYCDISIAVSTERGLVVPVIRNAQKLSFAGIESVIADFGKRAKANEIKLEELQGGTFTITNGGVFGSLLSTPIINPPQSAILGMHKIEERVIADNGNIKTANMMYLALSYDHRIIDGKDSVGFLVKVKSLLEDPISLLLDL